MKSAAGMFFLLLAVVCFRDASARSAGAPTAACDDLTQQHSTITPMPCGPPCPYTVSLVAIDGSPPTSPNMYRCGSQHTIRIQSSGPQQYRGFAIQARESTPSFSSSAAFVGQFISPGADSQIWACEGGPSATHINSGLKTSVDVTWQAPGDATSDVTLWFSITLSFTTFHAQLRGLDLSPDPSFCSTGGDDIIVEFDPVVYGPITEGAQQSVMFRVVTQAPPTSAITVLFSTVPQTAIAGEDFVARENVVVTFAAGESERSVEVMIIDDDVYETQECFMAELQLPPGSTGVQLGQQSQANAVIFDDDEVTVTFNPTSYTVNEGESVEFIAELIGEAQASVAVMFQTRGILSATPDQDFVPLTSMVGFTPGVSLSTVSVRTLTDSLDEEDEVFEGILTLAPGSVRINLAADTATAVIRNRVPDPLPQNPCLYITRTEL